MVEKVKVEDEVLERVAVEKMERKDVVVEWVERLGWSLGEGRETGKGEDVVLKVGRKRREEKGGDGWKGRR